MVRPGAVTPGLCQTPTREVSDMDYRTCPTCQTEFGLRRPNQVCCSKSCADKAGRVRRKSDPARTACSVDGCARAFVANGYCHKHWRTWHKYGDPTFRQRAVAVPKMGQICAITDCAQEVKSGGLCSGHYKRMREERPVDAPMRKRAANGTGYLDAKGYRRVTVNGKEVREHRLVMEQVLGRPMERWESPHHKNGIRHDNHPGNLELWVKPQPSGQRAEDLVAWVVEHYPQLVREALVKEFVRG